MRRGAPGAWLLPAAGLLLGAGCAADPSVISPRYQELAPQRVAVMPVENGTLIDLTKVTTAGLLQSLISSRQVNIPEAIQRGLVEGLEKKGYVAPWMSTTGGPDYHQPVKPPPPPFDGVLYCQITGWRLDPPSSGGDVSISGTVELVRVADAEHSGGEVLYQSRFSHRTSNLNEGIRTNVDLEEEGRLTGLVAIKSLPPMRPAAASNTRLRPPPVPLLAGPGTPPLEVLRP